MKIDNNLDKFYIVLFNLRHPSNGIQIVYWLGDMIYF